VATSADSNSDSSEPSPSEAASNGAPRVVEPRNCYICKTDYHEIHFFYDQLCPSCAEFNWEKRSSTADLSGRSALITGARVKIGYQAAIMMLRAGARVIVLTRFARDAAKRYAGEPDFEAWRSRLSIYGIDLRHTPSVETFARHLCETEERLDFIINNACQTVRRPAGFYQHLMDDETESFDRLPEGQRDIVADYERFRRGSLQDAMPELNPELDKGRGAEGEAVENGGRIEPGDGHSALGDPLATIAHATGILHAAALSQVPLLDEDEGRDPSLFPVNQLDADLQQVDLRDKNSWRLGLAEVPAVELLEVHLVNAVAPFILNARLKPLMQRHPSRDKHIVNVSAVEGQFYRAFKTDKHPHTNMAKAALNMMTRTSASDYVKHGIHMNSVDTGWVTDEDPREIAERKRE
jgi:NAD(P)-dependent dehydrogenase (short-subunit alcohol dehydrogenase family)